MKINIALKIAIVIISTLSLVGISRPADAQQQPQEEQKSKNALNKKSNKNKYSNSNKSVINDKNQSKNKSASSNKSGKRKNSNKKSSSRSKSSNKTNNSSRSVFNAIRTRRETTATACSGRTTTRAKTAKTTAAFVTAAAKTADQSTATTCGTVPSPSGAAGIPRKTAYRVATATKTYGAVSFSGTVFRAPTPAADTSPERALRL